MRLRLSTLVALVVLPTLTSLADSRAAPPAGSGPALRVPFERFRLDNGLTVILHEDHRVPTVTVNLWFRVGSKDERAGRSGFAHLFEHLMFMGTSRVPNGSFDSIMEAAGGSNNASTSEDRTNYFETGPAQLLETFLFLEADRLATLADDMTREKVDLQRDVVKNERRQSYENRPYGKVELLLPEHLWPLSHPYHHTVIGSHEDLTAASVDDVKDFFRAYYVPANASLVVAGDFRSDEVRKLVERYFAWMPKRPEPAHAEPTEPPPLVSQNLVVDDAVELPQVTIAFRSPAAFARGDAETDLLAAVLGLGKSSRLHRALVKEQKIAQSVEVQQQSMRYGGELVVQVLAQSGRSAAELQRAIEAELARLGAAPPTEDELGRARALVETELLKHLERGASMADALNQFEFYFGDPSELERRLLSRYDAVRVDDLARVAKQVIVGQPRVAIQVVPAAKPAADKAVAR